MKKLKVLFSEIWQFIMRFKRHGEFVLYVLVILGLWVWQWYLYGPAVRVYQDILIAAFGLQVLNLSLAIALARKARLMAQFLMIGAILFGVLTIYYLTTIVSNVV